MSKLVTIIDYGMGNVLSVRRAFEAVGAKVILTDDLRLIRNAARLVLPGVGAFGDCMEALKQRNLISAIKSFIKLGNPLLGICVGMQVLMDEGEEHGLTSGMGVIEGRVESIPKINIDGVRHNIPHIGWAEIYCPDSHGSNYKSWHRGILKSIPYGSYLYFVHSFSARPKNKAGRLADCYYGGQLISAAVTKENVTGFQFHPEKSGKIGLNILSNFLTITN